MASNVTSRNALECYGLDGLPKADISRWCVRIKRVSDMDEGALVDLIREASWYAGDYMES